MSQPAILKMGSGLEIMARKWGLGRKSAAPQQCSVLAKIAYRRAEYAFVEADVVDIDAGLEIVSTLPVARLQVKGCGSLLALRVRDRVFKVAALA